MRTYKIEIQFKTAHPNPKIKVVLDELIHLLKSVGCVIVYSDVSEV